MNFFNRRVPWWKQVDPAVFLTALAAASVGWMALWSVSAGGPEISLKAMRQGGYLIIGFVMMIVLSRLDYRKLRAAAWPVYGLALALLVAVMLPGVGHAANGAQRWISLGPFGTLQPSEFAKLAVIFLFAHKLSRSLVNDRIPARAFLETLVLMAVPFLLIAAQPDLGTSLVVVACGMVMLFLGGANILYLAGIVFAGLGVLPFVLHDYQRNRLLAFMDPTLDPSGVGYNLLQSQTALGSGGLLGKGLFKGPMSQHGFVPENETDFIITVIGEEMGLVAVLGLLFLFLLMLLSLARVLNGCNEPFGALLVTGVMTLIAFQVIVNMGMTMGLLPVVGIPLPFNSYGGSAMLTNFAALGLASSVARINRTVQY